MVFQLQAQLDPEAHMMSPGLTHSLLAFPVSSWPFLGFSLGREQEGHQHNAKSQQHPSCTARTDGRRAHHRAEFPYTHVDEGEPEETEASYGA